MNTTVPAKKRNTGKGPSLLRILLDLFPAGERLRVVGVLALIALAALFETVGVAAIFPFMSLIIDPAAMNRYRMLHEVAQAFSVSTPRGMLLLLGAAVVAIIATGNFVGALNVWVLQRFLARSQSRLSSFLFTRYLRQPYAFHVQRDGPSLIKILHSDVGMAVYGVVYPALNASTKALVAVGILSLLFVRTPLTALTISILLTAAYYGVYRTIRDRQKHLGLEYNQRALEYLRLVQESFGGIKELQVLGREAYAIDRHVRSVKETTSAFASSSTLGQLPRYALETIAFGGIVVWALAMLVRGDSVARDVVPTLAWYAFAALRLMPAIQQVFLTAVGIRFSAPILRGVHEDLLEVRQTVQTHAPASSPVSKLSFSRAIELNDVSFVYPNSDFEALRGIQLEIRPFESMGFVGRTGAGKTTLADLVLGLYEPTQGSVKIDGVPLTGETVRAWRSNIGYVSQHVFLSNASIAENIAFGLPPAEIDLTAVRQAATLAQADEFISKLPAGFDTIAGERGVKLSGGQRQRIGIARALYHNPQVLVFDEATSALDGLTEDSLMEAIRSLSGDRTVILIAHRLRTVEACDRIIMLDAGRVVADGSYDQLLRTSASFRELVGGSGSQTKVAAAMELGAT